VGHNYWTAAISSATQYSDVRPQELGPRSVPGRKHRLGQGNGSVQPQGCPPAVRVSQGASASMMVDATMASSVMLRRQACGLYLLFCLDTDFWENIAVFSEPNFYTLFGGRMVTIDWFFDNGS
jgi:hypothetical protein